MTDALDPVSNLTEHRRAIGALLDVYREYHVLPDSQFVVTDEHIKALEKPRFASSICHGRLAMARRQSAFGLGALQPYAVPEIRAQLALGLREGVILIERQDVTIL